MMVIIFPGSDADQGPDDGDHLPPSDHRPVAALRPRTTPPCRTRAVLVPVPPFGCATVPGTRRSVVRGGKSVTGCLPGCPQRGRQRASEGGIRFVWTPLVETQQASSQADDASRRVHRRMPPSVALPSGCLKMIEADEVDVDDRGEMAHGAQRDHQVGMEQGATLRSLSRAGEDVPMDARNLLATGLVCGLFTFCGTATAILVFPRSRLRGEVGARVRKVRPASQVSRVPLGHLGLASTRFNGPYVIGDAFARCPRGTRVDFLADVVIQGLSDNLDTQPLCEIDIR